MTAMAITHVNMGCRVDVKTLVEPAGTERRRRGCLRRCHDLRDHRRIDRGQGFQVRHRDRLVQLLHRRVEEAELGRNAQRASLVLPSVESSPGDPTLSPAASRRDRARFAANFSLLSLGEKAAVAGHPRVGL